VTNINAVNKFDSKTLKIHNELANKDMAFTYP